MATRVASIRGVGVRDRAVPRMGLAALAAACLALGLLTLAAPTTPTYDPWAWLIWGREILHLDLVFGESPPVIGFRHWQVLGQPLHPLGGGLPVRIALLVELLHMPPLSR